MAQNQNSGAAQTIKMDSRKFLSALNDSAQAKIAFFEERVQQMGQQVGKNWRLAALNARDLFIEDLDTHDYFMADHARDHGKVTITNLRPVNIVEGEKKELFEDAALKLIVALESNDQKEMAAAFNRLKAQRFSSRAVPYSGLVRCRDGVLRHINISNEGSLGEDVRDRLIAAIVEGLRDRVIVENGHVVAGYFDQEQIKLPVTKWAARKQVARRLRDVATNAYWSEGFQTRIYSLAKLISEGKIEEAVKGITTFLDDMEEFTLLTRGQTQTLVENTLAAKAVFNQQLCNDTATLFHRTNLRVNKSKIVEEWRRIAKVSEHSVLAENVQILEQAKNFEAAYDKFLKLIFEAISNREVAAEALATTLDVLRNKTPKIKESHELSSKLNGLISRLKQRNFDDAAIYEAEDLIATIQEELAATDTLSNFDQMPGDMGGDMGGGAMDAGGASGAPVININSPLIQIGGQSSGAPGAGGAGGAPGGEEAGASGDPELEALLGGSGAPPAGGAAPAAPPGGAGAATPPAPGGGAPPLMQGKERQGKAIAESSNPRDPYAIRDGETVMSEGLKFTDYGAPVITDDGDLDKIIKIMHRLATEHKLTGKALQENLENMARASIKVIGLRIPAGKLGMAVEQAVHRFAEEWEKPWLKKEKDKGKDKDSDTDEDDEGVQEDQYKIPLRKPRGMAKSNFAREMGKKGTSEGKTNLKKAISEGISWGQAQEDAMLGEFAGVKFIFDHGGADDNLKPVILSEDASVEIPIPEDLYDDAFAAAKMTVGDGSRFVQWLAESIEQLRPITDAEDRLLDEAVAKITAGPDGTLSVEVSDDVEVNSMGAGDEMGAEEDGLGGDGMGDDGAGMAPVDATDPNMATDMTADAGGDEMDAGAEETMPDFESSEGGLEAPAEDGMGAPPAEGAAPAAPAAGGTVPAKPKPEDDDGLHFEDRDITNPPSAKYTAHVRDNKRKVPEVKVPGKTNDRLESIGPDLKVDDGSGTKPPTAKKGSDD